ncbi:MAG: hypothetical protein EBU90_31770, partial [Proteobacteria bacterium]|nr:hypothetical protein [Pseudomonadota bacterium]
SHAGKTYTMSVWLKKGDTPRPDDVELIIRDGIDTNTNIVHQWVTPPDEWTRFYFTGTFPNTVQREYIAFGLDFYDSYGNANIPTGTNVLVWGAQLEESTTVGPYLKTTDQPRNVFYSAFTPFPGVSAGSQDFPTSVYLYALSSYDNNWGWPLETAGVSGIDVKNYYKFFEYIPVTDNTLVNNILNFDDVTNTLSENLSTYSDWTKDQGIVDNILSYGLYTGCGIISARN